jgi:cytochrome P450
VRSNDIVSLLIDARDRQTGEPMSDRQMLDEILTLIVAGHETTASSLNWFWYLLTQAPEVTARLHAEVDAGPGGAPGYEQLADYPYARRALDETMRLYPPGWLDPALDRGIDCRELCIAPRRCADFALRSAPSGILGTA